MKESSKSKEKSMVEASEYYLFKSSEKNTKPKKVSDIVCPDDRLERKNKDGLSDWNQSTWF